MELIDIFENWKRDAQLDLRLADDVVADRDWDGVVFHSQQALEKLAKGIVGYYNDGEIPFMHDLETIIDIFGDKLAERLSEERLEVLAKLSIFYLEERYPVFIGQKLIYDDTLALYLLGQTKEIFQWLLKSLPPIR
ncbi:MAG: HEPN domain-containing protein [Deltaproteobacteria bacterium]|jgi:HEPN domain-containing protein|nr:HEPN domain-containing protein [Deltaproteobacteria bacterium]